MLLITVLFCRKRSKMLHVFDIVLAGCLFAILCTFFNIQPWMWLSLPFIRGTSGNAESSPPQQQQQGQGLHGQEDQVINHQDTTKEVIMAGRALKSVDFEVFGKVQGVFFRKFTRDTAKKHGLVGWVKNTHTGTVVGVVQGPEEKVDVMKKWLQTKGSPKSRIDRVEFKNSKGVEKADYPDFRVVK